jgi:hypothetical protein
VLISCECSFLRRHPAAAVAAAGLPVPRYKSGEYHLCCCCSWRVAQMEQDVCENANTRKYIARTDNNGLLLLRVLDTVIATTVQHLEIRIL